MNNLDNNITGLLKTLKSEHGSRHPIKNHPLTQANHLTKNRYLKHLCALMLYYNVANNAQRTLLERLVSGVEAEHQAERYLNMALDININSLKEFIEDLKNDQNLKYIFTFDAIVLCHLNNFFDKQAELLGELLDAVEINKFEFQYITLLAKSVLTLDIKMLKKTITLRPRIVDISIYKYVVQFFENKSVESILRTTQKELDLIKAGKNGDSVVSYLEIHDDNGINFVSGDNIYFYDCTISCGKPIKFGRYSKIFFENCKFHHFKTETILFQKVSNAEFYRCDFLDCIDTASNWMFGGIYSNDDVNKHGVIICDSKSLSTNIDIEMCRFSNCGIKARTDREKLSILSNGNIQKCINNSFKNCHLFNSYSGSLDKNRNDVLFQNLFYQDNNKFNSSSRIH